LIDQVIASWSFVFSFLLIRQFEFTDLLRGHFAIYVGLYCLVYLCTSYMMRIHTGLIRYSGTQDILRIFTAVLTSSLIYGTAVAIVVGPMFHLRTVNIFVVLLVNFFISSSLLIMLRIGAKALFYYIKRSTSGERETVMIYGSNGYSLLVKQALETSGMGKYIIAGFIDDNPNKVDKTIQQVRVYRGKDIKKLHRAIHIDKLFVLSEDLKTDDKKKVIEKCVELGIKVLTVPPTAEWMTGHLRLNQIQDLKIEDLLQRPPIVIENKKVSRDLSGKRVLITGGAGSIGSEIVRQVLSYNPEMVIICDQAESPLHDLQLEMEEVYPGSELKLCIADIQNFNRMYSIFKEYTPHFVYHAAAYKHVPMMENNPAEAILTNVQGTKNLADLSMTFDVEKFVMISTDKAVNPTNIMGASKRIAEIYIQSLNSVGKDVKQSSENKGKQTRFITTRFGNVLGSNGSVIPRFRAQIQKGGPITVTHPDITRYFMTIPEAVQLVLEAGTMGKGGEIFIFDMGEPVKIVNLAKKMIKLAGLVPGVDIDIVYSGLRPGEKLYEELLNEDETTIPTHHNKIKISKVREYAYNEVVADVNELLTLSKESEELAAVKKMKGMVPEFLSKNSRFEQLDTVTE
jgi:FlaA1/EpsC-like NDP-sugar epimerase